MEETKAAEKPAVRLLWALENLRHRLALMGYCPAEGDQVASFKLEDRVGALHFCQLEQAESGDWSALVYYVANNVNHTVGRWGFEELAATRAWVSTVRAVVAEALAKQFPESKT